MKLSARVKVTKRNYEKIIASHQMLGAINDCIEKLNEAISLLPKELDIRLTVNKKN